MGIFAIRIEFSNFALLLKSMLAFEFLCLLNEQDKWFKWSLAVVGRSGQVTFRDGIFKGIHEVEASPGTYPD